MTGRVITGRDFMKKWAEALDLPEKTCRVVIDARMDAALTVYVTCFGSEDMLTIEPPNASDVKIVTATVTQEERE